MAIDVLQRGDLPFPRPLPEFQRLFPDEAAGGAAYRTSMLQAIQPVDDLLPEHSLR